MELWPEIQRLVKHQLKVGGLQHGDKCYIKVASDGTNLMKKDVATATTITIANETRALGVGTISVVLAAESYKVRSTVLSDD